MISSSDVREIKITIDEIKSTWFFNILFLFWILIAIISIYKTSSFDITLHGYLIGSAIIAKVMNIVIIANWKYYINKIQSREYFLDKELDKLKELQKIKDNDVLVSILNNGYIHLSIIAVISVIGFSTGSTLKMLAFCILHSMVYLAIEGMCWSFSFDKVKESI